MLQGQDLLILESKIFSYQILLKTMAKSVDERIPAPYISLIRERSPLAAAWSSGAM